MSKGEKASTPWNVHFKAEVERIMETEGHECVAVLVVYKVDDLTLNL